MRLTTGAFIYSIPSVRKELTPTQKKFWERWIDALRSNKYIQVRKDLCNISGFSCLGVAADLLVDDERLHWTPLYCGGKMLITQDKVTYITCLPIEFSKQIGLMKHADYTKEDLASQEFHITLYNREKYTLQQLNEMGVKFQEIATILEWALKGGYTPGKYYGFKD